MSVLTGEADAAKLRERRAVALDQQVMKIKAQVRRNWLEMGKVLAEIQDALAYRELGYSNFQQYAEDRVGISARWANYLVCMVRKARKFGVRMKRLKKMDISKCLEIFRVNDAGSAKRLVASTIRNETPLKELKQQVAAALGRSDEEEPKTIRKVWYFTESQWGVVQQAIKVVCLATDSDSESYAIELIAADYLAGIGVDPDE